ncbi:MAG: hypothetical protein FWC39_08930 [Bacteroidetes bacterium]|nr:hypothetical protein [Bacteroidota bacterium]
MDKKKKDVPLIILKSLEKFVALNGKQFEVIDSENFLLKIIEKDDEPTFYFNIEKYEPKNGVVISTKPKSETQQGEHRALISVTQLETQIDTWLNLVAQYKATHSFYDDPIVKAFSDEYFADFEIIEEDVTPLTTKQILFLDEYLEYLDNNIDTHKTEENGQAIESIKQDISSLRKNLTTKSKSVIARGFANIWGKLTKLGTEFIINFTSEAKRELVKQSVKGVKKLAAFAIDAVISNM